MSDQNAKGRKVPASPGLKGAIKDAVVAISDAIAPPKIKGKMRDAELRAAEEAAVYGSRKQAQSTDHMN
jgi:hypothetical protein